MRNPCTFLYYVMSSVNLGMAAAKRHAWMPSIGEGRLPHRSARAATRAFVFFARNRRKDAGFGNATTMRRAPVAVTRYQPKTQRNIGRPDADVARWRTPSAHQSFVADEHNWREHPALADTLRIPTVIVPAERVHPLISGGKGEGGLLAPFLASHMKELTNIHPRVKLVQNLDRIDAELGDTVDTKSKKAVLLNPESVIGVGEIATQESRSDSDNYCRLSKSFPRLNKAVLQRLSSHLAEPGPVVTISLTHEQQTIQTILGRVLPREAQPPPTGFEQIGHVIHLNLKSHQEPCKKLIGSVILDRLSPKIQSVVNKVGEVSGPYRTYDMEVLAGKSDTNVQVNEDGVTLDFDLRKVYWCTRLSGERKRLLRELEEGQVVADAFCGAGALVVQAAAKHGCTVYANDLNPDAVRYCRDNAERNLKRFQGRSDEEPMVQVTCGDAFHFIQNLGNMDTLPHHVVMNFPLDSPRFLGALRSWPAKDEREVVPTFHLYTFARGDDPDARDDEEKEESPPRDAVEVAVDLVAEGLLPRGEGLGAARKYRRACLDDLGCRVEAREIRDVAPGKVVVCVSFKATDVLLRTMQGDFADS